MTTTHTTPQPPGTTGAPAQTARAGVRTQVGLVLGDKRDKTRTVAVDFQVRHPKYGKYLKRQSRFQVHDEKNESHTGDRVEITNCRPLSKTKSWRLVRVVEKAPDAIEHKTEV